MSVSEIPREAPGRDAAISIRRMVNENIAELAMKLNDDEGELFIFLCECGELQCRATKTMTLTQFWATGPGLIVGH